MPGSIPARAGEPMRAVSSCWVRRVYPRACGGTYIQAAVTVMNTGLSPRVRGNLRYVRR